MESIKMETCHMAEHYREKSQGTFLARALNETVVGKNNEITSISDQVGNRCYFVVFIHHRFL